MFFVFFGSILFCLHRSIHIFLKTRTVIQGIERITLLRPLWSPRYPEHTETLYEGGFTSGIRKMSVRSQVSEVKVLSTPGRDLPESRMSRDDVVQKERTVRLSKFRSPSRNLVRKQYVESTALSCFSPTQTCGSHTAFNKELATHF